MKNIGLLTTFILGLFILIGALISMFFEKHEKIINFSVGLAFGVIVGLIVTDLIPELIESLGFRYLYIFIIFSGLGFYILKWFDGLIPAHHEHYGHHHHSLNSKEKSENLEHIGFMTTIALVLHNIIEGMAVYSSSFANPQLALTLALGVGFHNIPLGMVICSSFYHSSNNKKKTWVSIICVSVSTFIGGIIMYLFNLNNISEVFLGTLLSITLGMLVFIVVDELFPRIKDTKDKKTTLYGILLGVVILIISMFFGE